MSFIYIICREIHPQQLAIKLGGTGSGSFIYFLRQSTRKRFINSIFQLQFQGGLVSETMFALMLP